ncbi:MAG: ribonuclease P protein component 3 [Methanophagales archaeon]|nr:ribonuclease P protein component 3 [Methanophagales archaeon]
MPNYFDLNVHAYPETETGSSVEELLRVARRYGYAGIAVTNHDELLKEELRLNSIALYTGVEIRANSVVELKRKIKFYHGKTALLAVHGGNAKINRAAVEDSRVDILAHPCGGAREDGDGDGDGVLNHVLVRYAAENSVAIDFNMNGIIYNRRGERARIIGKMRDNLRLLRKYKAPMILTSNARSVYDLRAPREMIALASLFGMTKVEATSALSDIPLDILERRGEKERAVEVLLPTFRT